MPLADYPEVTSWTRTFTRTGEGRKIGGRTVNLSPRTQVTYIWGPGTKSELNRRMRTDAARLLNVNIRHVIMLDEGDVKTLWAENGIYADVVRFERARGGRS